MAASIRFYNRVARSYDNIYDDAYWQFHDEVTWRHLKPHLPTDANAHVADLGCGTGKWGLRLLKTGYPVTFSDNAPAMVGEVRGKLAELGGKAERCVAEVADIVDLSPLPFDDYALITAMGDPLSICSDPPRAVREMAKRLRPGGVIVATADNLLAGIEHYAQQKSPAAMLEFLRTGRTQWLTPDPAEQYPLKTFTPAQLRKLFEKAGLEVLSLVGKCMLPVRKQRDWLADAQTRRELVKAELSLADESTASYAGHLQIAARRTG